MIRMGRIVMGVRVANTWEPHEWERFHNEWAELASRTADSSIR